MAGCTEGVLLGVEPLMADEAPSGQEEVGQVMKECHKWLSF